MSMQHTDLTSQPSLYMGLNIIKRHLSCNKESHSVQLVTIKTQYVTI